jgi:hypothetical protein
MKRAIAAIFCPDRDIDAIHRLLAFGLVRVFLVDDGVQNDGGLTCGAVADDEFALPAPDGNHRVDGFDARLQGLLDGLAGDDARRNHLDAAVLLGDDGTLAIDGSSERVHHAPKKRLADRHFGNAPRALDGVALLEFLVGAKHNRADAVLFEVQHHAHYFVRELQQLAHLRVGQPVDTGDSVADLQNRADALGNRLTVGGLYFLR